MGTGAAAWGGASSDDGACRVCCRKRRIWSRCESWRGARCRPRGLGAFQTHERRQPKLPPGRGFSCGSEGRSFYFPPIPANRIARTVCLVGLVHFAEFNSPRFFPDTIYEGFGLFCRLEPPIVPSDLHDSILKQLVFCVKTILQLYLLCFQCWIAERNER